MFFHMLCNLSFSIHWRCRPLEEISHGKSRGPKKIKHRWTPKENGLPKKVPKKPLEFSKTWPPRSTVTEKWRYVKSRKSRKSTSKTSQKTCRQGYRGYPTISPYEGMVHPITLSTCLVSLSPDFLLVHFAGCLKGNTGHNTELVPCQKEKSPQKFQECFCSAR